MHANHQFQFRHLDPQGNEIVSTYRADEDQPIDAVVTKFFDFMSAVAGYDLRGEPEVTIINISPKFDGLVEAEPNESAGFPTIDPSGC